MTYTVNRISVARPRIAYGCIAWLMVVLFLGCTDASVETSAPAPSAKTVELVFDFAGQQDERRYDVAWTHGMTAMDALVEAGKAADGIKFTSRGDGEFAFVMAIAGVENEGGAEGARNWIFKVNGEKSPQGAGSTVLGADDVVLWKFSTKVE